MFNFLRRKSKEEKALHSINSGAWNRVLEPFAGAWQRNIEIRLDSVLAYPAIFSCISLISSDIAKMPMAVKRRQSNGVWIPVNNPVLSPLLIKPNFYQTAMQFFELWMISKLAHGNAYILKLRDEADRVRQLRVLDPRRVIPYVADDGEIFYSVLTDELNGLSGGLFVPSRELIHDRFNTLFHPLCGLSPIYASGLAAVGGEAMLRNSAHIFQNGGKPSGIIVVPGSVDQDKAKEIKDNWNQGYSGENAGKTALLADGASFVAVSQNATDSQLVEQLNLSNQLVASTFRVPLYKIDTGQTPSYNNIEALEQAYYSQCLQVHMTAIECLLADTFSLDTQTCVEFDHSRLLRMDTAARYKSYGDGIGAGFLAPNEARIKENMQPVEGGDTPYLQQQNYSLEALAKRDAQGDPFSTNSPPTPDPSDDDPDQNDNDPSQPVSDDEQRYFAFLLANPEPSTETDMITEREISLAKMAGQTIEEKTQALRAEMERQFENMLGGNHALIEKQEAVNKSNHDQMMEFGKLMAEFGQMFESLMKRVEDVERDIPDESAIASSVFAQIEIPEPEKPDIKAIVEEVMKQIIVPQPEPLPDIALMVMDAVKSAREDDATPEDIREMVHKAVSGIEIPKPEPVQLPDIGQMVSEAVSGLQIPQPEPLPDIKAMVSEAVSQIEVPKPEPLPDVAQLVADAVKGITLPEPEPLPDIAGMVKSAVESIEIPQPDPLPDIGWMVQDAINQIPIPQPEPLPDINALITEAVAAIDIPKPEPLPDIAQIVKDAVSQIQLPEPAPLPDIDGMIKEAVRKIELPKPAPLPDIGQLIEDVVASAVGDLELPKPEPLPDIDKMVLDAVESVLLPVLVQGDEVRSMIEDAVSEIKLPEPEPLPDLKQMVSEAIASMDIPHPKEPEPLPDIPALIERAVSEYPMPEPEPVQLPDFEQLVSDAVKKAVSEITLPEPNKGEDGRDGLQIEVMPEIDVSKSYPRGTYALHNGGLWRAYQKTAGMSGFECVVNGLDDIHIDVNDDRHFTVSLSKSNGQVEEKSFDLPVMIYRDVYQPGRKYVPGDCVTFAGSLWHCFEETSDRPNEAGSAGWRLAVKRGRDGRSRE